MTNLQNLQKAMEDAKRGRFIIYDNPESSNKKIIVEPDINEINMVTISGNKVKSCSCGNSKPCKHMVKVATKFEMNMELEPVMEPKKSKPKTKKSNVVKLKTVGE